MRRIHIALAERGKEGSPNVIDCSFVWEDDMTWKQFLARNKDALPVARIAMAKRRGYDDEMRTPLVLHMDHKAEDIFPRATYKRAMVVECILDPDTRI